MLYLHLGLHRWAIWNPNPRTGRRPSRNPYSRRNWSYSVCICIATSFEREKTNQQAWGKVQIEKGHKPHV